MDLVCGGESLIEFCCNISNVNGEDKSIGGICGRDSEVTVIRNCYLSSFSEIKYNGSVVTNDIGNEKNNYVGKFIGISLKTSITDFENVGVLTNTLYYVVNGNSNENSQYWSNSNVNEPNLLWEE